MWRVALVLVPACSFQHGVTPEVRDDADVDAPDAMADAVPPDAAPTFLLAYNLNGPQHVGVDFPGTWAADPGNICDGTVFEVNVDVANTVDDPLFTRYRYSGNTIDCTLGTNLPPATYEVTLLFGEVYYGPGCPEENIQRLFDVLVEGTVVEDNLNTVTVGGCCNPSATNVGAPFKRVYVQQVTDGTVNVALRPEQSAATMVSAVMLRRY